MLARDNYSYRKYQEEEKKKKKREEKEKRELAKKDIQVKTDSEQALN